MKYKVILQQPEEGFAVSVPGLPGCHSQGSTEQEALDNIATHCRISGSSGGTWPRQNGPRSGSQGGVAMPKLPGVNHLNAVRALEKIGFWIARQGKHIVMTDGGRIITIP